MQTIFITSGSGNIGSILIPSLLARNDIKLVLPTSNASKLAHYKDQSKVTVLEGQLSDPRWVEEQLLMHAVDTVFLNLWGLDELFVVFNTLDAIQRTPSIKHVVYLSACGDFLGDPEHTIDWMAGHTKIKPPVEKALQHITSFTHTVIGPSLFFENDFQVKDAILHGRRWVQPFGDIGSSRVAVADLALAVEIAILDRGVKWNKKKIMVGSLEKYRGDECAAVWTAALGFDIAPVPSNKDSLDKLELNLREKLGPIWARDLRLMYEGIIKTGFGMSQAEYDMQVQFLGRAPATYEDFVQRLAVEWKKLTTGELQN